MPNEITAEELARKAAELEGGAYDANIWEAPSHDFLILTRAHAALQAQPTDAPEKVRVWHTSSGSYTFDEKVADLWIGNGWHVTPRLVHSRPEYGGRGMIRKNKRVKMLEWWRDVFQSVGGNKASKQLNMELHNERRKLAHRQAKSARRSK